MAWSPIVGPLILVCLVCFGLYWRWTDVEHWLKGVICRGMSNALNVDVSMGTLQIRWLSDGRIRVYVSGLVVGCYRRADFSAPYFAAVGRLEVTTAGIFGLLSLPGVFLIGESPLYPLSESSVNNNNGSGTSTPKPSRMGSKLHSPSVSASPSPMCANHCPPSHLFPSTPHSA